jgi:AAHS family 3-hydroxyphenylpropionic acid transporter
VASSIPLCVIAALAALTVVGGFARRDAAGAQGV